MPRPDAHALVRGFYGIVNVTADGPDPVEAAASMARGGARCIQLRYKDADPRTMRVVARGLRETSRIMGFALVIDDFADVAGEVKADGVHVGQQDLTCAEARRIVGSGALVGVSTHNEAQLLAAIEAGADYVGFGPIFPSVSKGSPDPVVGLDGLVKALSISPVPVVAIGGITLRNAREVVRTGVHAITAIDAVYSSGDVQSAAEAFGVFFATNRHAVAKKS
ncbi:MAG: thiamine phosphate synthase [Deltaproteobacteria bacterium]|nr:thiamine phosphate synthase [Deltaproteobacteria bacterium]